MKMGYIIPILLVGLLVAVLFLPQLRQTFLKLRSEKVTIALTDNGQPLGGATTLDLNIITVLGKDGIPAIINPVFLTAREAQDNMRDEERVLGVSINGENRAYPLNLLSRHEIVNDTVGGQPVAVTWWPLCFMGIVYAREIAGSTHTFGVSGKLIMNALVMYDHQSDTLWSQFLSRGVRGPLAGTALEIVPSLQTTWGQWLGLHPDTLVLDKRGRFRGDTYESYYQNGSAGIIGESNKDNRLPTKELVVGLDLDLDLDLDLEGKTIAYPFREISNRPVINDFFAGQDVLVTFEPESETGVVFNRRVDGWTLHFRPIIRDNAQGGMLLMQDDETSTVWQALTGRAIDGELEGTVLTRLPSHYSFWFA